MSDGEGKRTAWANELRRLAGLPTEDQAKPTTGQEPPPLPEPGGTLPGLVAALDQLNLMPGAIPEATKQQQRDYMRHLLVTLMKQLMATVPKESGAPAINALLSLALALDTIDAQGKQQPLFKPEQKPKGVEKSKGGRTSPTGHKLRRALVFAAVRHLEGQEGSQTKAAATLASMVSVKVGTIQSDLNKAHDADALTMDTAGGIIIDSDERLAAAVTQLRDLFTRR